MQKRNKFIRLLDGEYKICYHKGKIRVVKARKVLQNGMSFANERETCGVFTRPLLFSALFFGARVLSVSLNLFWEIFLCSIS